MPNTQKHKENPQTSPILPTTQMFSKKKKLLRSILRANAACGCGTPKLSEVYQPTPKLKSSISQNLKSCEKNGSLSEEEDYTSTTFSLNIDTTSCSEPENDSKTWKKIIGSIAVVKDSNDPYQDFRDSMLEMIWEKEIYSNDELQELLNCFLELNSPCQHEVIVQAFTDIWNWMLSVSQRHHVNAFNEIGQVQGIRR